MYFKTSNQLSSWYFKSTEKKNKSKNSKK